jgi:hypothetical protein
MSVRITALAAQAYIASSFTTAYTTRSSAISAFRSESRF